MGDLDKIAAEQDPPFVNGENYFNVSMGQGQDVIAMSYLESAHRNGSWVILNNIHLMPKWLLELEKKLDSFGDHSHDNFRLFLSSDPAKNIPIGILNRCIKLTNEPPGGLKANLVRAFCFFSKESFEELDSKTKSILFGLCHFHAVMMERKLYGPMGYNMMYPFAVGDLRDSAVILSNYMENSGGGKIPWMDLKYLFGEVMYGGHIVNDFDRLTCKVYLDFFMKDELLDETEMYPYSEEEKGVSFMCPAPTSYDNYLKHINATLTSDTPVALAYILMPRSTSGRRSPRACSRRWWNCNLEVREMMKAAACRRPKSRPRSLMISWSGLERRNLILMIWTLHWMRRVPSRTRSSRRWRS